MNIATFNIRVQVPRDKGNRSWLVRRKFVADVVKSNDFDIFGVQEMGDIIQRMSLRFSLKDYSKNHTDKVNIAFVGRVMKENRLVVEATRCASRVKL